jgi:hypothetical protein
MILKDNGITNVDTWRDKAPPMGKDVQWVDGRSAKELARYMTQNYPLLPQEMEDVLKNFVSVHSEFEWAAEYVTRFEPFGLGRGEGRNHDAFLYNDELVVGIEGKADEPFGSQLIGEALKSATFNKKQRIHGMMQMLFSGTPERHEHIRYQLVTATTATLLEATKKHVKKALLLVIVFKKLGCYSEEKVKSNDTDVDAFLKDISARKQGDYYIIPTPYGKEIGIDLFFRKIEIVI